MTDRNTEFLAANRRNWDERVPIHRCDRCGFYAVERFLRGEKRLHTIEVGELVVTSGAIELAGELQKLQTQRPVVAVETPRSSDSESGP